MFLLDLKRMDANRLDNVIIQDTAKTLDLNPGFMVENIHGIVVSFIKDLRDLWVFLQYDTKIILLSMIKRSFDYNYYQTEWRQFYEKNLGL